MECEAITPKEAEALLKFRKILSDLDLDEEQSSNEFLIRWLRARDLHLKKSEEMLRAHLKWRSETDIEAILAWEPPELYTLMFPMEMCGYDRNGYPVVIVPTKYNDPDKFWDLDQDEYMRFCIRHMENALIAMKKYNTPERKIFQCVIIYDFDEVNLRPFMNKKYLDFMRESSEFYNANYPELIHRAYCLYSPKLFTVLWAMVKHVIPKKSQEKFRIYGHKPESWTAELLEHIPAEILPTRYGGSNTEFMETAFRNCKVPVRRGSSTSGSGNEDLIATNISAGKKLKLKYKVEEPKSILKWTFKTEAHDIGFSVHFGEKEMINQERVQANRRRQEGVLVCEQIGEYTVVFDNTYSRMRSKTLYYRVELEGPTVLE